MSKDCITCRISDDMNESEVPLWSKEDNNYSMYPKFFTCDDDYNIDNKEHFKEKLPKKSSKEKYVEISVNVKDCEDKTWIFYWAAKPSINIHKINGPVDAYDDYSNSGLIETDNTGSAKLKILCPLLRNLL